MKQLIDDVYPPARGTLGREGRVGAGEMFFKKRATAVGYCIVLPRNTLNGAEQIDTVQSFHF